MFLNLIHFSDEHKVRVQSNGQKLPEPRVLQLNIFLPESRNISDFRNLNVMQVGQWATHDMSVMRGDFSGKNNITVIQKLIWLVRLC